MKSDIDAYHNEGHLLLISTCACFIKFFFFTKHSHDRSYEFHLTLKVER